MKKKWTMLLVVMFALTSIFLTSCSDDDDSVEVTINSTQDLVNYMDNHGMDITSILTSWIKTAGDVNTIMTDGDDTNDYYIIDVRSAAYYEKGHIPGAVNSPLVDIISEAANANGKTIAVVCYSGQSACHGVVALRLAGFSDAFSIKWGMSGWHNDVDGNSDGDLDDDVDISFDKWSASTAQLDHANWVAAPGNAALPTATYALPAVTLEGATDQEILLNRAQYVVNAFSGVAGADVLAGTGGPYFVNNFWGETDVTTYGNIDGAVRINPLDLNLIDPDLPVVTYCWTGQTSSMVTGYLKALGYNALSLKNGVNSMIYDDLSGHYWDAAVIVDLPLEGTLFP